MGNDPLATCAGMTLRRSARCVTSTRSLSPPRKPAPVTLLRRARGSGLPCGFKSVSVGLKDSFADVALYLVVAHFSIREIGKEHVEPAVYFL
jgi:hypothetical protein